MNMLQLAQLQSQINTLLLASMNHAIKLNSIADSIWPEYGPNDQSPPPKRDLNVIQEFLSGFSLNELHQVMGLCNHKALFLVLEKADFIINRFSENLPQLLRQMDIFFQTWINPAFQFNLKRPFDTNVLQYHIQGSIQKLMGKILKEISKAIAQSQWDLISGYLINLGSKSKYYQILIISGYFQEIQTMETQFQEFETFKEIFKNFEYQVVAKVITVVIGNVSLCKEDLQLLEIEALQNSLSVMNETESMKSCISVGRNSQLNVSRLKYLRNNFEVLRKIIDFNYDIYFVDEEVGQSYKKLPSKKQKMQKKQKRCVRFPNYIVKPFIQENFLTKLYQIVQLLISLELEGNKVRMTFADIILELIGKIIKTKMVGFNTGLKEKFLKELLSGQARLMKAYSESLRLQSNLVLKILKNSITLLKTTTILDLITFQQSQLWFIQTFKLIHQLISRQHILTEDSYLFCKALYLARQLVLQTVVHQLNTTHELFTRDVIAFGLKVLQIFMYKFVGESQGGTINVGKYHSLEDLISKRDRYFHNVKILCQIYLSSFNQMLKSTLIKINSVPQALNFLLFISYILNTDLLKPTSFYYACQQDDIINFKKIAIGNTLILADQLMKHISTPELLNWKSQDVIFLMIQKLLQLAFENNTDISLNMLSTDIYLKAETNCCTELSSTPRLLKMLFGWMFKIIQVKVEKYNGFQQQIEPYFHILVKYLKLLMNEDYQMDSFQLISIQCELTQQFIEFKHRFRACGSFQERRNLSQITLLLHQEPQSNQTRQDNDKRRHLLFHSQIRQLLKILQSNPNDWIGLCYQIGGFLQCISKEQTYVTVISLLGKEFVEKLSLSCLNHPNLHSIKLLTYFNDSFLEFTEDHKIKNLKFWLPFLKNILYSWTHCLKLICSGQSNEQSWEQLCYQHLINLLTNDNLNFYLLKRSTQIKEVLKEFTTGLMDFLNSLLHQKCKSLHLQNTNLFRVLKIVFKYFSEFYILNEKQQDSKQFFLLINRLIILINNHLKMINNRKIHCVGLLIDELKPLNTILQFLSSALSRYRHKVILISKVQQFIGEQKQDLLLLQSDLYKFRVNYEKHLKFQEEKYRESQVNLLNSISQLICSLCNKQKSQKNNDYSTMSVSDGENALQKERDQEQMRQEEMQKQMEQISLLEKQLVWFDIEGNRTITEY